MQVEVSITESEIGLFEMDHGLHFTTYEQPHFELLPFNKTFTSQTFFDISKPLKDIQGLDSDGQISMLSTDVLSFQLKVSEIQDDSLDGEREMPTLGGYLSYLDFLIKEEMQMADNKRLTVNLEGISRNQDTRNFLFALKGLEGDIVPTEVSEQVKSDWLGGETSSEFSAYEQAQANLWLS